MLYCTKCQTVCADSARTCPNCKRSRALRPIRGEDEVFFLKVREAEAAELEELFESQAIRCRIEPVKAGFSVSVFDSEFLPTDKNIFVEYQDLERANQLIAEEAEEPDVPEDDMPRGKRMIIQTVSIIAFMVIVMLLVLSADTFANWLKNLLT